MTTLVASNAFDMATLIQDGSLAEFFEFGEVQTGTETTFLVTYSDETISEQLTLTGTFANYVDGYPTTGTIETVSYWLDGSTLFEVSNLSISVEDFTDYVMSDNLQGLFEDIFAGFDLLTGSDGNDVLIGFGGDDTLRGGLGSDTLQGGDGNDLMSEGSGYAGPFNDTYDGGAGIDRVSYFTETGAGITIDLRITGPQNTGSFGVDTLVGVEHVTSNYGNDTIIGDEEDNWFWTFSGTDTLTGNGGDDYFTVGLGTKVISGGTGSDTVEVLDLAWEPLYTSEGITVSLLSQGESQATGVGNWTLTGIENLVGSYGSDDFTGDSNANYLGGGEGDDRLIGGHGDDTLAGDGTINIDSVDGTSGPIVFLEDPDWENWAEGDDYLDGGAGNDRLIGGEGDDFLIGGAGLDVMDGGEGADVYVIAASSDHALAEVGDSGADDYTDEVRFSATGTAQTLLLRSGDTGIEHIVIGTGTGATASITGLLAHNVDARALLNGVSITGNSGANALYATAYADSLSGGNSIDRLYGYAGNDTLDGGREADVMYGGEGDDTYIVDNLSDAPIELSGQGTDTVLASVAHTLKANVENLTMTSVYSIHGTGNGLDNTMIGNSGANRMWGEDGHDTLIGNDGYDQLDGGAGNDTLIGGTGNDIYFVDSVGDTLIEAVGEGRDTVRSNISWELGVNLDWLELGGSADVDGTGNELANVLKGNSGANVLWSLEGNDKIYAGLGDDTINGGAGNDWLEGEEGSDFFTGGTGSDRFVFREGDFGGSTFSTADVIVDFSSIENDIIRLDLADANSTLDGDQDFTFLGTDAFTGAAGELRYYQNNGDTYLIGDTDGDGIHDIMIRLLGTHDLTGGDFIL